MVKVIYICERCEEYHGKPQMTKDKNNPYAPKTPCEYCGYTGKKRKRVVGTD